MPQILLQITPLNNVEMPLAWPQGRKK